MIQQRGARWRVVVQAPGRDPFTGRRRQLSGSADSEPAARRLEEELRARIARMARGDQDLTLAQVVEEWWADKPRLAPTSTKNYRENLNLHILPALGERPVREIRPRLVAGFLRHLEAKGLGPGTIRKVRTVLSAVMAYATAMEHVDANPVMKVPPPELAKGDKDPPTIEETARILLAAEEDPAFLTYLLVAAEVGGRRGEVLGLRWRSIDIDAGTVTFAETISIGEDGPQVRPTTKTGNDRKIALSAGTMCQLDVHRRRCEETLSAIAGRPTPPPPDAWVFNERDGRPTTRPWRPDSTSRKFRQTKERAGVRPEITLHALRHAMITELIAAGVDPRTVMARAGHSSEAVTMGVYAHLRRPNDAAASELYAELLRRERDRLADTGRIDA
ncbi:MAG TPA: site-specific integrase [Acidimicrobiales bacterium]|nr:site-specific integrase [Acidimicrobiales bacterium]